MAWDYSDAGRPVRTDDGRDGTIQHRLDGVWADLVQVKFGDGSSEAIADDHLEVVG